MYLVCVERARLGEIHTEALREWARLVREAVKLDDSAHRLQLSHIDKAKATADDAKDAYRKHIEQHGCLAVPVAVKNN
jgi:hypothetical protein